MNQILSPKRFLQHAGILFFILGILGYLKVLGPNSGDSIFGVLWWFDTTESAFYTSSGVLIFLGALVLKSSSQQKAFVIAIGTLTLAMTLINFQEATVFSATFQAPFDTIFHLFIALWAFLAIWNPRTTTS